MLAREMLLRLRQPPTARPARLAEPVDAIPVDEPAEEEQLTDKQFFRQLRSDVDGVRAGLVPSITDAMRPAIKQRPWAKRRKKRDRYGRVIG